MVSRCLGSAALLVAGVEGARIARKRAEHSEQPNTKFIAGVPVLNYQTAYEGLAEGEAEGEWVVMVNDGATDAQIERMCKLTPHGCKLSGHPSEGGVAFLEMRGTEQDLENIIHSAPGLVKFVEPDSTVSMIPEIEAAPEAKTWGLNRIGADARGRSGGKATVFVLDTGVRATHNDFGGRASSALDMTVGSPKECNGDLSCAGDKQGHGTHCAGSAAGETYGVAPGATVKSVKVLSDQGSGSWSWSYYALDWLATNPTRPAIASMSLGGSGTQQAMRDAVNAAVNSGVVVVVAGGNSNSDACRFSPAFVPAAITVGSTDSRDRRSSFSNYGSCTDMWAPGSDVTSAGHRSDTATATFSGTSMACPHVSGGAALILDEDPNKAPAKVLSDLLNGAVKGAISGLKSGDTNALLFVGEGGPPPAPPAPPAECPFYCGMRLCLLDACVDNCDFCQDNALVASEANAPHTKEYLKEPVLAEGVQCSSADHARMQQMGGGTRTGSVAERMAACGRSTLSWTFQWQPAQFIACASQNGISKSCAGCFEQSGRYGYNNCKTACLAGWCTAGCLSCVAPYDPQLEQCTGALNLEKPTAC